MPIHMPADRRHSAGRLKIRQGRSQRQGCGARADGVRRQAGAGLAMAKAKRGAAQGVDITGMVNELSSSENGAVVFASCTGRQQSMEDATWKNGAFTEAVLEGLGGKADLLGNGKITVSTLEAFVAERVKALTEGEQTPTVAKPQTITDFPIAVKAAP